MAKAKREIVDVAQAMIDRYGETAVSQVQQRVAELEARGEHEAARLWKDIGAALKVLSMDTRNQSKQ